MNFDDILKRASHRLASDVDEYVAVSIAEDKDLPLYIGTLKSKDAIDLLAERFKRG